MVEEKKFTTIDSLQTILACISTTASRCLCLKISVSKTVHLVPKDKCNYYIEGLTMSAKEFTKKKAHITTTTEKPTKQIAIEMPSTYALCVWAQV